MTDAEIKNDALSRHPECGFAEVVSSLDDNLNLIRVALLWPNEECFRLENPPKHRVDGYPYGKGRRVDLPLR